MKMKGLLIAILLVAANIQSHAQFKIYGGALAAKWAHPSYTKFLEAYIETNKPRQSKPDALFATKGYAVGITWQTDVLKNFAMDFGYVHSDLPTQTFDIDSYSRMYQYTISGFSSTTRFRTFKSLWLGAQMGILNHVLTSKIKYPNGQVSLGSDARRNGVFKTFAMSGGPELHWERPLIGPIHVYAKAAYTFNFYGLDLGYDTYIQELSRSSDEYVSAGNSANVNSNKTKLLNLQLGLIFQPAKKSE